MAAPKWPAEALLIDAERQVWRYRVEAEGIVLETTIGDGLLGRVGDMQPPESVVVLLARQLGIDARAVGKAAGIMAYEDQQHALTDSGPAGSGVIDAGRGTNGASG